MMSMMSHFTLAPLPTRAGNAASLAAIPTDALPDGPARRALLALANAGADCRAYHPRNKEHGWQTPDNLTIWLEAVYPAWEARQTPAQWVAAYALATGEAEGGYRSDEDAVRSLAGRYRALWASGYRGDADDQDGMDIADEAAEAAGESSELGMLSDWRRPDGLDDLERALSLLRWHLYIAAGREGLASFRQALAAATPITSEE